MRVDTSTARARHAALVIEWLTLAWMTVEAAVAVASGLVAHSIALIGFGLDSAVEWLAAAVVIWQFRRPSPAREHVALQVIAGTFFILAAYVGVDSVVKLVSGERPGNSLAGIAVSAAAIVVMPLLAFAKLHLGRRLDNDPLIADSAESLVCALLAAVVLVGLALNAALHWWWADPVAALVVAGFALREGIEVWREEKGEHEGSDDSAS